MPCGFESSNGFVEVVRSRCTDVVVKDGRHWLVEFRCLESVGGFFEEMGKRVVSKLINCFLRIFAIVVVQIDISPHIST